MLLRADLLFNDEGLTPILEKTVIVRVGADCLCAVEPAMRCRVHLVLTRSTKHSQVFANAVLGALGFQTLAQRI